MKKNNQFSLIMMNPPYRNLQLVNERYFRLQEIFNQLKAQARKKKTK